MNNSQEWRNAYRTADPEDPLSKWLFSLFRYYRRTLDGEIEEIWRKDISHIPVDELDKMWAKFRMDGNQMPQSGMFARRWRERNPPDEAERAPRFVSTYGKLHPCVHHALTGEGSESLSERPEYQYAEAARLQWMEDGGPDLTVLKNAQRYYVLARKLYDEER